MNLTWAGIIVLALLAFSCAVGYRRGFIREAVSMFCVILSIGIVWFINPYVNTFICENTPAYEMVQESSRAFVQKQLGEKTGTDSEEQAELIEDLNLPAVLANQIEENNTAEMYRYLAVDTFSEYVSGYLARIVVNGLSFLVSYILATLLIRMITWALNLIARLPVINGINRLAGAALGAAKYVIFLWVIFLLLTVFCSTQLGEAGLKLIEQDAFLKILYDNNIFMKIFMNIFYKSY